MAPRTEKLREKPPLKPQTKQHSKRGSDGDASGGGIIAQLPEVVGSIFDQVQHSMANHKKNAVGLYKIFLRCSGVVVEQTTVKGKTGGGTTTKVKRVGERAFQDVVLGLVGRVVGVKRGVAGCDRVVRFVAGFVRFVNEKGVFFVFVVSFFLSFG